MEKLNNTIQLSQDEKREKMLEIIYNILPVISVILLLLLWLWASSNESASFPSPKNVYDRFLKFLDKPVMKLSLFGHVGASLKRVFTALVLSWILGISFGVLLGWNKKCRALLGPLFTAFRAVPPLAWIPLVTIWFGIGEFSKILIVFLGAVMPVVVNTQAGMSNINDLYLQVGRIFHASNHQILVQIAIPSALDAIFAGIRTSASAGWTVVLAAEMLGGKSGVGFLITRGMDSGDLSLVLLSMVCIGIVGAFLSIFTQITEGLVCPWTVRKK